jgi:hypothetical protein
MRSVRSEPSLCAWALVDADTSLGGDARDRDDHADLDAEEQHDAPPRDGDLGRLLLGLAALAKRHLAGDRSQATSVAVVSGTRETTVVEHFDSCTGKGLREGSWQRKTRHQIQSPYGSGGAMSTGNSITKKHRKNGRALIDCHWQSPRVAFSSHNIKQVPNVYSSHVYRRWDSNPQAQRAGDLKSPAYTNSATPAKEKAPAV